MEAQTEINFPNASHEQSYELMPSFHAPPTSTIDNQIDDLSELLSTYFEINIEPPSTENSTVENTTTLYTEAPEETLVKAVLAESQIFSSTTVPVDSNVKAHLNQSERIRILLSRLKILKSTYGYNEQITQRKAPRTTARHIMSTLEEEFEPIDFKERAGLQSGENLKNKHYQIIAVEEILRQAEQNGWGIGQQNDSAYIYDGSHWKLINAGELREFLSRLAQRMGIDQYDAKHHLFIDSLYKQFMEQSRILVRERESDVVLINLANGTFEVTPQGQRLRPADKNDFLTYQLPFAYDPDAQSPLFDEYLRIVQPDEECQRLLAEFIGYLFVSSDCLKLEKALILYGSGANGKSVFFEIILALLGTQNVSSFSLASLTDEKGYHRAKLQNVLVNYASEITEKLDANMFKQLASGEPIEARLPYGQPFILTNYAKLIFNCNELPRGAEQTPAFFRRFSIVPFDVTIPESRQDRQLSSKIIQRELSGVFNWVLNGLKHLLEQRKLTDPPAVREQLKAYQLESDSVKLFLDEFRYVKSSSHHRSVKDLYNQYRNFCLEDGHRPVSRTTFMKRLRYDGFHSERKNIGWVIYLAEELRK
ncbi:phage/plasmid primase, P4 family [Spirosoma daeguense]